MSEQEDSETAPLLRPSAAATGPPLESPPFRDIAFLCLGLWMSMFSSAVSATVVTNLQLTIGSYFEAADLVSWLGAGYLLGLTGLTPLYGKIAEIMGRRAAMIVAFTLFTLGTVICAAAPSMGALIFGRLVGGSGGGGLLTLTAVIISDTVSIKDRGVYQGYVNLVWATGSALGALVGGWVADSFGWRWAFWLQLPTLGLAFVLILWKVHPPRRHQKLGTKQQLRRIDWLGLVAFLISITSLLVACSLYTHSLPDLHPLVLPLLALFAASLFALYLVESRFAKEPLIPISILTQRTPALVIVSTLLICMNVFARFFMCPIYIHVVKGLGGRDTGLLLLPSSFTLAAGAVTGGYYMRKTGHYKGFTIITTIIPVACSASFLFWGVDTNVHRIWSELALASFSNGIIITNVLTALVAAVPPEQMATATSLLYLARAVGQVLGAALSAGLQLLVLQRGLSEYFAEEPETAVAIIRAPERVIPTLPHGQRRHALEAYLRSLDSVFVAMVVTGLMITLCFCFVKAYRLDRK